MSKKDDVKKEEAAKVEAPEKLVSVEMTQEQLDAYTDHLAKAKEEKELLVTPAPEPKKFFKIDLMYSHNINGRAYGPGRGVEVPDYHLGLIQQGENMSRQQEIRLHTTSNRMFKILDSGQAVPVAVSTVKV
jgi:hypothetical protein